MTKAQKFYTINEVAEKIEVHPQTLRNWEKEGLITPQRIAGKQRVYSKEDVETVEKIMKMKQEGMQIKAIKNSVLGLNQNKKEIKGSKNKKPAVAAMSTEPVTRKRGRPRKNPVINIETLMQKGLDELLSMASELNIKYARFIPKPKLVEAILDPSKREQYVNEIKEQKHNSYISKKTVLAQTTENLIETEEENVVEESSLKLVKKILALKEEGKTEEEIAKMI